MTSYQDLGAFSFCFRTRGVYGMGLSASSNFAVAYSGGQCDLKHGAPLCSKSIAAAALSMERSQAEGLALAVDDVSPIVFGGCVRVRTQPDVEDQDLLLRGSHRASLGNHPVQQLNQGRPLALRTSGVRDVFSKSIAGDVK